jgi:Uma2 family endonuclease
MIGGMTAEELLRLSERECRHELWRGELRSLPFNDVQHSDAASNICFPLSCWIDQQRLGRTVIGVGFRLASDPDTVRAVDVAFLSGARLRKQGRTEGYWPGGPDLAVEVVSVFDLAQEVRLKVADLLGGGARLIWLVFPNTQTVTVYRVDGSVEERTVGQSLDGEDVVPGFSLPVAEVFNTEI